MKKHCIYLFTDANRTAIEVAYCNNITHRFMELQQTAILFAGKTKHTRIVHTEDFASFEEAQQRKLELQKYTHMMKERLIRKHNPNWLSLMDQGRKPMPTTTAIRQTA